MKRRVVLSSLTAASLAVILLSLLPHVQAKSPANASRPVLNSRTNDEGSIAMSPASLSFGYLQSGMKSPQQTVTVTNNGASSITLISATVPAGFAIFNSCPHALDPGASCTIGINFDPTGAGRFSGNLTLTDTDTSSPQNVALTAAGLGSGSLGGPLANLTSDQTLAFQTGFTTFNTKWDPFRGLGPVYTQAGCFTCHGSGIPGPTGIPGDTSSNMGTRFGRFNSDGTFNPLDGSGTEPENEGGPILHPQTVADIPLIHHCHVTGEVVPGDATVVSMIRSPQLFGLGLIDSIPEATILANQGDKGMGINGVVNMVPDQNGDLHVGRFGQKASVPTLLFFTLSAMFNELGITSPTFLDEHIPSGDQTISQGCETDPNTPQDVDGVNSVSTYQFEALLAPAPTQALSPAAQAGKGVFESIGCNLCHMETMQTDPNATVSTDLNGGNMGTVGALANQTVSLYSDLLLHDMGPGLSGGIPQGQASLTQWRTAPLWGLSTRAKFGLLHDARTTDLDTAIRDHGGEASQVIDNYTALSPKDQSSLITFLLAL